MKKYASLALLLIAFIGASSCLHMNCPHDKKEQKLDIDENDKDDPFDGRMLQTEYENIRIYADYSLLDSTLEPRVQSYIKEELMPPVINYYQNLLKVVPRQKKLTYKKDLICGLPTPAIFREEGVDADVALIIDASYEVDSSYIAYARACTIQNGDNRPTFGNAHFNLKYVKIGNEKTHDENLLVALHELAHVFGISKGLFEFYYDPETQSTKAGHVVSRELNGKTSFFVDVEPLTSKLKEFFDCPTLEGALLENEGEAMSASHLERRVFYSEIMTAGEMEEARISEFMLAFLEGTGWYKGNYSMTEPVYWGKGKGCDFYYSPCIDRKSFNPNYEEFCPSLTELGCSVTRKLGASCGTASSSKTDDGLDNSFNYWGNYSVVGDIFADNCPYFVPNSNKDCQDPNHQSAAFLGEESYGFGSKCFSGTLAHPWQFVGSKTNYCFKSNCVLQKNGKYFLEVQIGNAKVTCKKSGSVNVGGFQGQMDCPDPSEYCTTYGKAFCERGCMGKGQCFNSVCLCDSGWGSSSCGMKVYDHHCKRCENEEINTSCFGDECVCNPLLNPNCPGFSTTDGLDGDIIDNGSGQGGIDGGNTGGNTGGNNGNNGANGGSGTNTGNNGGKDESSYSDEVRGNVGNNANILKMVQPILFVLAYVFIY